MDKSFKKRILITKSIEAFIASTNIYESYFNNKEYVIELSDNSEVDLVCNTVDFLHILELNYRELKYAIHENKIKLNKLKYKKESIVDSALNKELNVNEERLFNKANLVLSIKPMEIFNFFGVIKKDDDSISLILFNDEDNLIELNFYDLKDNNYGFTKIRYFKKEYLKNSDVLIPLKITTNDLSNNTSVEKTMTNDDLKMYYEYVIDTIEENNANLVLDNNLPKSLNLKKDN